MTDHTKEFAMLGCMCDKCIQHRVRERKAKEEAKALADAYIARRGGEPKDDPPPSKARPASISSDKMVPDMMGAISLALPGGNSVTARLEKPHSRITPYIEKVAPS